MEARGKRRSMKIVPAGKKKCVWMEAGVVSYKLCDNNYDCSTCQYDHAMQLKVSRQMESVVPVASVEPPADTFKFTETWVEKMMKLPASHRKCRYMMTGEVGRKICPNAYACGNCSFDQMMQERLLAEVLPVRMTHEVGGFEVADDMYYHEGHTWARPEYGGRIRVGLDDFARKLLGNLSRVELPNIGQSLKQGEIGFRVKRNGDSAQVLSPVDGIVEHVNDQLSGHPDLVHESPYEKGWLFIVEPTKLRKNLKGLYFGEDADHYMREEREHLFSVADDDLRLAADGGAPVEDVFKEVKGKNWAKFVKQFLRT